MYNIHINFRDEPDIIVGPFINRTVAMNSRRKLKLLKTKRCYNMIILKVENT